MIKLTKITWDSGNAIIGGLLIVAILAPTAGAETRNSIRDPGQDCAANPELRTVRALDFGDARILRGHDGFLTVSPRGDVANSIGVLAQRGPLPGELSVCGRANQEIAIVIDQPSLSLRIAGGSPVARVVKDILVEGDGIALTRVAPGRWEGRLGVSGRAAVRLGATLYFSPGGSHGMAGADLAIDVVAR